MDALACRTMLAIVLVPANHKPSTWFSSIPSRTSFCQALEVFSHQAVTHSPRILYRNIVSFLASEMTPISIHSSIRIRRSMDLEP